MNFTTLEKRYNTINNYYRSKYGCKVFKVSLNAGFTCPNRDGLLSNQGCTYCSPSGSGDFAGNPLDSLANQFITVRDQLSQKWPKALYIAYLQANTNTYGSIDHLRKIYEEALNLDENIIGLSISTRPDCINDEVVNLLKSLNKEHFIQVELGLQTIHQKTSDLINRGHNLACFDKAVALLRSANIEVVVHIINGLPFETKAMMLETIEHINKLDIQGIKIHLLHIMKNTPLGLTYLSKPFATLSLIEYVDIVVSQLRILRPDIIVHRLTGDAPKDTILEPMWSLKKFVVINEIDKKMRLLNAYQGDKY